MKSFSKWLPGGHIRFFGFWMAWFRQCNSSLLWNFSFKFHVHLFCGCRQKLNDCQLCRFQNGCLVILNNVQLQSTYCPLPPSPMGGGILVDHWSTISSLNSCEKDPYLLLSVSYGYILEKYWPCDNSTVSTAPLMWWLVYHIHVYVCGPVDCYMLLDGWHYEYQWCMRHGILVAGIALLWLVGLK